eukprot:268331-Chlamydomonas_euryale.AAC.5
MGDGHELAEPVSRLHPHQRMLCNHLHRLQFTDNFVSNSVYTFLKDVTILDKPHASTCFTHPHGGIVERALVCSSRVTHSLCGFVPRHSGVTSVAQAAGIRRLCPGRAYPASAEQGVNRGQARPRASHRLSHHILKKPAGSEQGTSTAKLVTAFHTACQRTRSKHSNQSTAVAPSPLFKRPCLAALSTGIPFIGPLPVTRTLTLTQWPDAGLQQAAVGH